MELTFNFDMPAAHKIPVQISLGNISRLYFHSVDFCVLLSNSVKFTQYPSKFTE